MAMRFDPFRERDRMTSPFLDSRAKLRMVPREPQERTDGQAGTATAGTADSGREGPDGA
jgi:hypothetical protein